MSDRALAVGLEGHAGAIREVGFVAIRHEFDGRAGRIAIVTGYLEHGSIAGRRIQR